MFGTVHAGFSWRPKRRTICTVTQEQAEVVAKLKEIEEQTARLLEESAQYGGGLARSRVIHIQNLARYLRSVIGTELILVKKSPSPK